MKVGKSMDKTKSIKLKVISLLLVISVLVVSNMPGISGFAGAIGQGFSPIPVGRYDLIHNNITLDSNTLGFSYSAGVLQNTVGNAEDRVHFAGIKGISSSDSYVYSMNLTVLSIGTQGWHSPRIIFRRTDGLNWLSVGFFADNVHLLKVENGNLSIIQSNNGFIRTQGNSFDVDIISNPTDVTIYINGVKFFDRVNVPNMGFGVGMWNSHCTIRAQQIVLYNAGTTTIPDNPVIPSKPSSETNRISGQSAIYDMTSPDGTPENGNMGFDFSNGVFSNTNKNAGNFFFFRETNLRRQDTHVYSMDLEYEVTDPEGWKGPRVIYRHNDAVNYLSVGFFEDGVKLLAMINGDLSILASSSEFRRGIRGNVRLEIVSSPEMVDVIINGETIFSQTPVPRMDAMVGIFTEHCKVRAGNFLLYNTYGKHEIKLTKETDGFKVTISDWQPSFKYQIWTYQEINSGVFANREERSYAWVLSHPYTLGNDRSQSGFLSNSDGSVSRNIGHITSAGGKYIVAIKIVDDQNNFHDHLYDTFTTEDVGEVSIQRIFVDQELHIMNQTQIKAIREDNPIAIDVRTGLSQGVTYHATIFSGNNTIENLPSNLSGIFLWDVKDYKPGKYTVNITAQGQFDTDFSPISFILHKSGLGITYYAQIEDLSVTSKIENNRFNLNLIPRGISGSKFQYTISEPWRAPIYNSGIIQRPSAGIFNNYITDGLYGIYHVIGRVYRENQDTSDDGIIRTVENPRPGNKALSININNQPYVSGTFESEKGNPLWIEPSASLNLRAGEILEYSYWRRDARGWIMIRDYDFNAAVQWTPARIGLYTLQVRVRGSQSGSYEMIQNLEFKISDTGLNPDQMADADSINLDGIMDVRARTPVEIRAEIENPTDENLLYKYIISNGYIYYIETQYSPEPRYLWTPGKAGDYTVSVLVKNQDSFGKFDISRRFTVRVNPEDFYTQSPDWGNELYELSPKDYSRLSAVERIKDDYNILSYAYGLYNDDFLNEFYSVVDKAHEVGYTCIMLSVGPVMHLDGSFDPLDVQRTNAAMDYAESKNMKLMIRTYPIMPFHNLSDTWSDGTVSYITQDLFDKRQFDLMIDYNLAFIRKFDRDSILAYSPTFYLYGQSLYNADNDTPNVFNRVLGYSESAKMFFNSIFGYEGDLPIPSISGGVQDMKTVHWFKTRQNQLSRYGETVVENMRNLTPKPVGIFAEIYSGSFAHLSEASPMNMDFWLEDCTFGSQSYDRYRTFAETHGNSENFSTYEAFLTHVRPRIEDAATKGTKLMGFYYRGNDVEWFDPDAYGFRILEEILRLENIYRFDQIQKPKVAVYFGANYAYTVFPSERPFNLRADYRSPANPITRRIETDWRGHGINWEMFADVDLKSIDYSQYDLVIFPNFAYFDKPSWDRILSFPSTKFVFTGDFALAYYSPSEGYSEVTAWGQSKTFNGMNFTYENMSSLSTSRRISIADSSSELGKNLNNLSHARTQFARVTNASSITDMHIVATINSRPFIYTRNNGNHIFVASNVFGHAGDSSNDITNRIVDNLMRYAGFQQN